MLFRSSEGVGPSVSTVVENGHGNGRKRTCGVVTVVSPGGGARDFGVWHVGMRPPTGLPSLTRRSRTLLVLALVLAALLLIGPRLVDTYTNWLWFGEVGFRNVYSTVLLTRLISFLVVALVVGGTVFAALLVAYRSRPVFVPTAGPNDPIARYRTTVMSRLRVFGVGIPVVIDRKSTRLNSSHPV